MTMQPGDIIVYPGAEIAFTNHSLTINPTIMNGIVIYKITNNPTLNITIGQAASRTDLKNGTSYYLESPVPQICDSFKVFPGICCLIMVLVF